MTIDTDDAVFSRADNHDIRSTVMLTADEYTWSMAEAKARDLSHSAYIRSLIIADRRAVEGDKLSHGERRKNTPDPAQVLHNLAQMLSEYR